MEKQKTKPKRKYSVPALDNAFSILKLLSRKRFRESTVTEIANALSLNPATCYRILQVLEEHSIVRYLEDKKRYTLGPYLVVLGERAKEHLDYISVIMPYMQDLTNKTGMTSILVNKISDNKLAIIAKVESHDYGITVSVGRHFSITDGSYGMCFLAYMDREERERHLTNDRGLRTFTLEDMEFVDKETEKVKESGFYVTYGEYLKGICAVAAPVFTRPDKVEMSIALVGLTAQFDKEELYFKGEQIKEVAKEISNKIMRY